MALVCCCCCSGRSQANHYDRIFVFYLLFFFVGIGTYVWTIDTRFSDAGRVCSGDYLDTVESTSVWSVTFSDTTEDSVFLLKLGKLLKTFVIMESIFLFLCLLAGCIWSLYTPMAFTRLFTSVDQNVEE